MTVHVTLNDRWTLHLPAHRQPQWAHPWEAERLASMHEHLRPGMLVYDIGAEEGDLPALWASWGCDVVLVEPDPRVWPNIRAIFDANQLTDRVRGCWVGFAGDIPRARPDWLRRHAGHDLWPRCADGPVIDDHGFLVIVERPDCPVTTIDILARRHGPPDAITIDVEGAELRVLRGAEHVLRTTRPLVWVSVHTDEQWMVEKFPGEDAAALADYMEGLGYRGAHLATDHEAHWLWTPG